MNPNDTPWGMVLDLEGVNPDYVLGIEAGMLYVSVKLMVGDNIAGIDVPGINGIEMLVHAQNAEMVLRIAERFGVRVRSSEVDETWMTVTFWKEDRDREEGREI